MLVVQTAKYEKDFLSIVQAQIDMAQETEDMGLNLEKVKLGVKAVFQNPEKGKYFVANKDGEFAGCLLITYEWSDWRNSTCIWIQSVFIPKKFRRKGVFTKMYQTLKEKVQKNDRFFGLRLYVEKENFRAKKVYQSLGMSDQHYDMFEWLDSEA